MATKKKEEKAAPEPKEKKEEKAGNGQIVLTPKDKSYPGWKPFPPS